MQKKEDRKSNFEDFQFPLTAQSNINNWIFKSQRSEDGSPFIDVTFGIIKREAINIISVHGKSMAF